MLSREKLEKRREELEADRVRLLANLNAVLGAIQILDEFLSDREEQPNGPQAE